MRSEGVNPHLSLPSPIIIPPPVRSPPPVPSLANQLHSLSFKAGLQVTILRKGVNKGDHMGVDVI